MSPSSTDLPENPSNSDAGPGCLLLSLSGLFLAGGCVGIGIYLSRHGGMPRRPIFLVMLALANVGATIAFYRVGAWIVDRRKRRPR